MPAAGRKSSGIIPGRRRSGRIELKKPVTLRLDEDLIRYFKRLAEEIGIPYQRLINLYLRECAASRRKTTVRWVTAS